MEDKVHINGSPTADGYYKTLDSSKVNITDGEEYISPYSVLFFDDCCCKCY